MNILENIKTAELKEWQDYRDFAKFIKLCWNENYGMVILHRNYLTLITGGWSENEEIQRAIDCNRMFNIACWFKSERGGKTVYELPKKKNFNS